MRPTRQSSWMLWLDCCVASPSQGRVKTGAWLMCFGHARLLEATFLFEINMMSNSYRGAADRAAQRFRDALAHFGALTSKYSAEQPRPPAGSENGGQWVSEQGTPSIFAAPFSGAMDGLPLLLAGGIDKEDMGKTVQDFASAKCEGRIFRELPGQFLNMNIEDVLALKKQGNRAADTCYKLFNENRFRKVR